jgi:VWFA-related protein
VDLVTVDLTAVDKDGTPILGLTLSDVTVLVDGSPRRIASFVYTAPPQLGQQPGAVAARLNALPDQRSALASSRTIVLVVDPSTMARGDGMQALHAAARFLDRLPATDRVSVAVLPQWETAFRFDASRKALKDRVIRGSGTGIINTPLDGRRRQEVESLFSNLASIEGPKQVVLIHGPSLEGDLSVRPSDLVGLDGLASAAAAWQSRVIVHTLEIYRTSGWSAMSADRRESSLPTFTRASSTDRLVSTLTGGLAMSPVSGDTFFERFEREQAGGYVLAFEPTSVDRDGRAHEIRVTIGNHPGTTVRTRHEFSVAAPSLTVQ